MIYVISFIQIVLALGLANVWLYRYDKPTKYRGGDSQNMTQEFQAYGLSEQFMHFIGTTKLIVAASLLLSFWYESLLLPAVTILGVLMVGAIAMHIKVKDELVKILPATLVLIGTILIALSRLS